jgi:hypothetical protein
MGICEYEIYKYIKMKDEGGKRKRCKDAKIRMRK